MKHLVTFGGVALVSVLLLTGCGQKQETSSAPAVPPTPAAPTTPTAKSAPAAPADPAVTTPTSAPSTPPVTSEALAPTAAASNAVPVSAIDLLAVAKTGVTDAMALAKQSKYTEALALLQQKTTEVQSNPEAKKLIDASITQIKQMATDAAAKALGGFGK